MRAKARLQTITPYGTPGLICQSSLDRHQTAVFLGRCVAAQN
jgi:hypothetical protein